MDYKIRRSNIDDFQETSATFHSPHSKHSTKPVSDTVSHYRRVNQVTAHMNNQWPYCMSHQRTDLFTCP